MPVIRRSKIQPQPSIDDVNASTIDTTYGNEERTVIESLRAEVNEILAALRAVGILREPDIAPSQYYEAILSLSPWRVITLSDETGGTFSGNYQLNQPSLIPNLAGASATRFLGGAVTIPDQVRGFAAYSFVCRFLAESDGAGGFAGFSELNSPATNGFHDREIYLTNDGKIAVYNYSTGAYTVTTPNSYRDGEPHTLAVRMGAGQTTAIFIDGVKVAESSATGAFDYFGYLKIGWTFFTGQANKLILQGCAFFQTALTDAQIASIHEAL